MILRRGVGALVPAGMPYFRAQGPLLPTVIQTIAGRQVEGPRGLGTNAVLRRRGVRGLGDVQYCSAPSAAQQTYLKTAGPGGTPMPWSVVQCGGTPTPQGTNQGNQPVSTIANPNAAPGAAPVYQAPTGIEDCVSMGLATSAGQACVARNTARAVAAENQHLADNAQYQTQLCISNGGGGWVPQGQDVGQWCAGQYGGSVTPGYVPIVSSGPSGTPVTPPAAGAAVVPAAGAARLSFQNLTNASTSQFQVGDKWVVSITGAVPNTQVGVSGGMNGAMSYSVMGSTDGSGNFSKSGQITADQVGTWQETWGVGDPTKGPAQSVGFIAFTVNPAATVPPVVIPPVVTPPGSKVPIPSVVPPVVTPPAVTSSTFDLGTFLTDSMVGGIPNWVLLAGVGGAVFVMARHR